MIFDLEGLDIDVRSLLVLFLDDLDELFAEQLGHVIHVTPALRSGDTGRDEKDRNGKDTITSIH